MTTEDPGPLYRPPSEAYSLLLQVTVGCSHNRCTYCAMYRDRRFAARPWPRIAADLERARALGPCFERVFLCDGDALGLSTDRLLQVLEGIRAMLPWVRRVGTYGDPRCIRGKTVDDLRRLREAGLGIVYHGLESGDDEVLQAVDKGSTRAESVDFGRMLREAGLTHSLIVMLGLGGTARSRQHIEATAGAIGGIDPGYLAALTATLVPGTPLHGQQQAGTFALPGPFAMLEELRELLARTRVSACRFSSNHASNYLPLRGWLPQDQPALLGLLDDILARRDPQALRPEWLRGL